MSRARHDTEKNSYILSSFHEVEKGSNVIVLISVGNQEHEGKNFEAQMDALAIAFCNGSIGKINIVVGDSVHRHNQKIDGIPEGDDYPPTNGAGWLEGNEQAISTMKEWLKVIKGIPSDVVEENIQVTRWDHWLKAKDYEQYKNKIEELYEEKPAFKKAVEDTVTEFLKRRKKEEDLDARSHCREYVKEELTAYLIWCQQGYHKILYPRIGKALRPMPAAFKWLHEHYIPANEFPKNCGEWLLLTLKTKSDTDEPDNFIRGSSQELKTKRQEISASRPIQLRVPITPPDSPENLPILIEGDDDDDMPALERMGKEMDGEITSVRTDESMPTEVGVSPRLLECAETLLSYSELFMLAAFDSSNEGHKEEVIQFGQQIIQQLRTKYQFLDSAGNQITAYGYGAGAVGLMSRNSAELATNITGSRPRTPCDTDGGKPQYRIKAQN